MITLRIFLYSILLLASAAARAELFKCTQADGKLLYTDRPCAGAPVAVKVERPAPTVHGPVTRSSASVTPVVPKYARDERKIEVIPTPEQIAARESYKKAYFAAARLEAEANMANIKAACSAGNAGACKSLEICAAIGGCIPK